MCTLSVRMQLTAASALVILEQPWRVLVVAAVTILKTKMERMTKTTLNSIDCFKLSLRKATTCQIQNIWSSFVFIIQNPYQRIHYLIIEKIPWQMIFHPSIHHQLKDMIDWWILSHLKLSWGMVVISFLLLACWITVTQVKLDLLLAQSLSLAHQLPPPLSLATQLLSQMDQLTPLSHSTWLMSQMD